MHAVFCNALSQFKQKAVVFSKLFIKIKLLHISKVITTNECFNRSESRGHSNKAAIEKDITTLADIRTLNMALKYTKGTSTCTYELMRCGTYILSVRSILFGRVCLCTKYIFYP